MKHRHRMPFGAQHLGCGRTRFSLWAPAAYRVELLLENGEPRPMRQDGEGFHTLTTEAAPGARYRYRIGGEHVVPDPASRYQPEDVHGPSEIVDPEAFEWRDEGWRGRTWEETALYELHAGAVGMGNGFTRVEEILDHLAYIGFTAVELMPVSDFPGGRNWGYDGVLPFAPDSAYGRPEDLKQLIQSAHEKGLMVFLDVVYNHFGPEGNYLHLYAPQFFTDRHETPWGAAVNFDGEGSRRVRDFFIHNALYWLEEYHLDGLRLDAVHAIHDDTEPHFLKELAGRVREGPGRERHVHLVLENDANEAHRLRGSYTAQWNDDLHHSLHAAVTGESAGYYADYADYADAPVRCLARSLAEGFAYQGEPSRFRDGARRGEPSADLPPTSFVAFVQNHDQVGNRAFGERLPHLVSEEAARATAEIYLLCPQIPMTFMGEEFSASTPFLFFCDFEAGMASVVAGGRREEFASFPEFSDPATRERIPDPNAGETFQRSRLRWLEVLDPEHKRWLSLYRELLRVRREELVPRLAGITGGQATHRLVGERGLRVQWLLGDGSLLTLLANLSPEPQPGFEDPRGRRIYASEGAAGGERELPAWSVEWYLSVPS